MSRVCTSAPFSILLKVGKKRMSSNNAVLINFRTTRSITVCYLDFANLLNPCFTVTFRYNYNSLQFKLASATFRPRYNSLCYILLYCNKLAVHDNSPINISPIFNFIPYSYNSTQLPPVFRIWIRIQGFFWTVLRIWIQSDPNLFLGSGSGQIFRIRI